MVRRLWTWKSSPSLTLHFRLQRYRCFCFLTATMQIRQPSSKLCQFNGWILHPENCWWHFCKSVPKTLIDKPWNQKNLDIDITNTNTYSNYHSSISMYNIYMIIYVFSQISEMLGFTKQHLSLLLEGFNFFNRCRCQLSMLSREGSQQKHRPRSKDLLSLRRMRWHSPGGENWIMCDMKTQLR